MAETKKTIRRIGVLTSGGDAPGMNAAVRSVVRSALHLGIEVIGIRRGWNGLINGDIVRLDEKSVAHIINRGGTMLYTARSEEFMTEAGQQKAVNTCKLLGLDGIVAIGGDGTFRGALALSKYGISVVGIPGTIDNDIACTDYCIGFAYLKIHCQLLCFILRELAQDAAGNLVHAAAKTDDGRSMRGDNAGLVRVFLNKIAQDAPFRGDVQRRGRLVQQKNGRGAQERTRDGDTLRLPFGEAVPMLADGGIEPARHLRDKIPGAGSAERVLHGGGIRVRLHHFQVFGDGAGNEGVSLRNIGKAAA